MSLNLSSFLQWGPNIIMCRKIGWNFTYYYISILGKLYFFFNRKEKGKIKKAVKTVFTGRKNSSELRSITKGIFRGILSHYYEKFINVYSTPETLRNFYKIHMENEGLNTIKLELSKGKGILLITGHYGGIEFIPTFLGAFNYPVSIVAKFKTNKLRDLTMQQANNFSINIIDADHTPNIVKAVCDDLRENRIVITMCDEIDEWKPCRRNKIFFLGRQIRLDKTINILSKRYGAAVVFGVMHRVCRHRYKFIATSREEMEKNFQRSIDMSVGAVVLKFMERYIYKYPDGWYQWKKYAALELFSLSYTEIEAPASIPLLKPSLGNVS
jgi:KDO2-lipid IV(A) lauroyltransferase